MLYPTSFEEKTGFDTIRRLLRELCLSNLGESHVDAMSFTNNYQEILQRIDQAEEFRQLLILGAVVPASNYFNLKPELQRLRVEGTWITEEGLFDMKSSMTTILDYLTFLKGLDQDKSPRLFALAEPYQADTGLVAEMDRCIDDKGKIRDTASPELKSVRSQLIAKYSELEKKLSSLLTDAKRSGWTPDDVEATIRNGRMVIPVSASNKRKVKGLIHDHSASGQTVYIEPYEVFELNNDIRDLSLSERQEIIRILQRFTARLRPILDDLIGLYDLLGLLDFIRAKAQFALNINACKPLIRNKPGLHWIRAVHPILLLSHREQHKDVVPLDITLTPSERILIISGPNAGGKSVCLKTVGLLQYMLQCGLLIPLSPDSEAGVFDKLFIDIGDEQSLENDLSTYSSHLVNMRYFLEHAGTGTLFLIDEFGAGTEPQLGGAIAETMLVHFNDKGAFGVVTTHYTNLKMMASQHPGMINGAMLFDVDRLQPLFRLSIGRPGSSFAFEIAGKTGLPEDIIQQAREKSGVTYLDFEKDLHRLESDKEFIRKKQIELKVADEFLSDMIDKYQSLQADLEHRRKGMLDEARNQAKHILSEANRTIEQIIREIRESQADKEKTRLLRESLHQAAEQAEAATMPEPALPERTRRSPVIKAPPAPKPRKPEAGMFVRLKDQKEFAEVLEVSGKNLILGRGNLRIRVPAEMVDEIRYAAQENKQEPHKRSGYGSIMQQMQEKLADFRLVLDVRGKTADEAVEAVVHYLDDAMLLSIKEVRILHGKGDGILRQRIRQYLSAETQVQRFSDEAVDRGGTGITVITLK